MINEIPKKGFIASFDSKFLIREGEGYVSTGNKTPREYEWLRIMNDLKSYKQLSDCSCPMLDDERKKRIPLIILRR